MILYYVLVHLCSSIGKSYKTSSACGIAYNADTLLSFIHCLGMMYQQLLLWDFCEDFAAPIGNRRR